MKNSGPGNTLSEAIENVCLAILGQVNTCLPGEINNYDVATSKAEVKPLIKKKFLDGDVLDLPVITNVPVVLPRSARGGLTFPLERGDGCLIVFSQRSMERWLATGVDSEPGDTRKFDLNDAICIPGLFSFQTENIASNNSDIELKLGSSGITIKANGDIEIGEGSFDKLVNEKFQSLFNGHGHQYTSPGGPLETSTPTTLGIPPVLPAISSPITSNELTSKVKAT